MQLIISDIHGCYDVLKNVVNIPEYATSLHIYLGDYLDRGDASKQVVRFIQHDQLTNQAVVLRGNHEELWLQAIALQQKGRAGEKFLLVNGGEATFKSFNAKYQRHQDELETYLYKPKKRALVSWLKTTLPYYATPHVFYTHGGVDLTMAVIKDTSPEKMLWMREEYWYNHDHSAYAHNLTNQLLVTGHTPTWHIPIPKTQPAGTLFKASPNLLNSPYLIKYPDEKPRLFIDAGTFKSHALNVILIDETTGAIRRGYRVTSTTITPMDIGRQPN